MPPSYQWPILSERGRAGRQDYGFSGATLAAAPIGIMPNQAGATNRGEPMTDKTDGKRWRWLTWVWIVVVILVLYVLSYGVFVRWGPQPPGLKYPRRQPA